MGLSHWQQTVLALFVEIGRIAPLVEKRVNSSRPAGLDEHQFAIISHLVGVGTKGESRASLSWAMTGLNADLDTEIGRALASGLVNEHDDRFAITPLGQQTQEYAVQSLSPDFAMLLHEFSIEDLETTKNTLREIRRTLDNLPDR